MSYRFVDSFRAGSGWNCFPSWSHVKLSKQFSASLNKSTSCQQKDTQRWVHTSIIHLSKKTSCMSESILQESTWLGPELCSSCKSFICNTYVLTFYTRQANVYTIHSFISIQPLGRFKQEPEPSQATGMALAHCILDKFLGVGCHCFPPPLDVPTFSARCLHVQRRERPLAAEGGTLRGREMFRQISSRIRLPRNSRDHLHAANLRHGTDGFTSPPKEGVLRIFFALKNPTASAGFKPANLGTKGKHATSRPPKPMFIQHSRKNWGQF